MQMKTFDGGTDLDPGPLFVYHRLTVSKPFWISKVILALTHRLNSWELKLGCCLKLFFFAVYLNDLLSASMNRRLKMWPEIRSSTHLDILPAWKEIWSQSSNTSSSEQKQLQQVDPVTEKLSKLFNYITSKSQSKDSSCTDWRTEGIMWHSHTFSPTSCTVQHVGEITPQHIHARAHTHTQKTDRRSAK